MMREANFRLYDVQTRASPLERLLEEIARASARNNTPKTSTTPRRECKSQCIRRPFGFKVACAG
jgi:hypothetical protein